MSCENVTLPKGDGSRYGDNLKPGEWGVTEDGHIMVRCPHAEHSDKLPRLGVIRYGCPVKPLADGRDPNWMIDAAGKVTPSIWFKGAPCDWHIYATLEGWTG